MKGSLSVFALNHMPFGFIWRCSLARNSQIENPRNMVIEPFSSLEKEQELKKLKYRPFTPLPGRILKRDGILFSQEESRPLPYALNPGLFPCPCSAQRQWPRRDQGCAQTASRPSMDVIFSRKIPLIDPMKVIRLFAPFGRKIQ